MSELAVALCTDSIDGILSTRLADMAPEDLLALLEASRHVLVLDAGDAVHAGVSLVMACIVGLFPRCFGGEGVNGSSSSSSRPPTSSGAAVLLDGAATLLEDLNLCLKKLQTVHCAALHAAKLKATTTPAASGAESGGSSGSAPRTVWHPHGMDALLAAQRMATLLRLKAVVTVCLAATRAAPAAAAPASAVGVVRRALPSLWEASTVVGWVNGAASLEQAEREFDHVLAHVCAADGSTVRTNAQACLAAQDADAPTLRAARTLAPAPACVQCLAPPLLPALPLQHLELRRGLTASAAQLVVLDATEAPFAAALRAACRGKLLSDQAVHLHGMLDGLLAGADRLDPVRAAVLRRFLFAPQSILPFAEKNKDTAVFLFLVECAPDALVRQEDLDAALVLLLESMDVGEPLCHIVKCLWEKHAICGETMDRFVLASIAKMDRLQHGGDDEVRFQRSAKLLSLVLNNLMLRRREHILSPEVEATLCELLLRTTRVRECAELYSTLCLIRKVQSPPSAKHASPTH